MKDILQVCVENPIATLLAVLGICLGLIWGISSFLEWLTKPK